MVFFLIVIVLRIMVVNFVIMSPLQPKGAYLDGIFIYPPFDLAAA